MKFRFETLLKVHKNRENLLQKQLGDILAHKQKQQNRQNLLKDARKNEIKQVTRKVKHDKIVMRDHVRRQLMRDVEYQIKHLRQRNAADCDVVAFINKKYAQIRQIMSE